MRPSSLLPPARRAGVPPSTPVPSFEGPQRGEITVRKTRKDGEIAPGARATKPERWVRQD